MDSIMSHAPTPLTHFLGISSTSPTSLSVVGLISAGFRYSLQGRRRLVLSPLFHLDVEGLAAPLPLDGGLSGTPRLKSSDPYDTGVDGGGIMREAALSVWLGRAVTDLIRPLVP